MSSLDQPSVRLVRFAPAILFAVAAIWGFAFAVQHSAGVHNGPFTVNAMRFFIALIVLTPVVAPWRNKVISRTTGLLSIFLFAGVSLQQYGVVLTTAGNAGFITGMYVVFVPLIGLFLFREPVGVRVGIGVFLSFVGLFLLSAPGGETVYEGDLWVLCSALAFAGHTFSLSKIGFESHPFHIAYGQCALAFVYCVAAAILFETPSAPGIISALPEFLYLGAVSTALGYTFQVLGQRYVPATIAGLILSLESVFAATGGYFARGEVLSSTGALGCGFILLGAVCAQLKRKG